jgi:glucosamine-6-phosphate deaminase
MEIIIQPTPEAAAEVAARIIARQLREKPDSVLGLATGSTPLSLYRILIGMNLDWGRVTTFNLDEYIGLPREHPQSYHRFMWENLFRQVNIRPENVHIPDGNAPDIPAFCAAYEESIRAAGGIDIQILGIGTDGHIGFNEPTSSLASRSCIQAPAFRLLSLGLSKQARLAGFLRTLGNALCVRGGESTDGLGGAHFFRGICRSG